MTLVLTSPGGAAGMIAAAFADAGKRRIQVCESGAFLPTRFLDLGGIAVADPRGDELDVERALCNGEYEWTVPDAKTVADGLHDVIGAVPTDVETDKTRRFLDALGGLAIRLGLSHPVFDPLALQAMPFRRPTTIVSDTSGVIQGGLSFVARNLHPAARLKVPGVVQMEIVNSSDRFLSNRRRGAKARKYDLLIDHVNSQAAQRVLLQLELRSSVELERSFLLGDPLRAAFKSDEEKELKELNLNVPIRSYADRLILEAARQHQAQVSPGHPVLLLTSDQGLARMAITEGLMPLYFRSAKADALFGRTHTGSNLSPFDGELVAIGLAEVLWELATIFGTARIASEDGTALITVHAFGDVLAWAPYQSHEDLLWVEVEDVPIAATMKPEASQVDEPEEDEPEIAEVPRRGLRAILRDARVNADVPERRADEEVVDDRGDARPPLYKMSIDGLFRLVAELDREQSLSEARASGIIESQSPTSLSDYRRFLSSADALRIDDDWRPGPGLRPISVALANEDADALRRALAAAPAFAMIDRILSRAPVGEPYPMKREFKRAEATYVGLAEATMLGAGVHQLGFFPTTVRPSDEEFVPIALDAYGKLRAEGGWASTGQWLEELITRHGVHPMVARVRLQGAAARGLLQRFFEGSTTDIKHDRHAIRVLSLQDGNPVLKTEYLYRGDFLMPGRGGSSLRISEASK